MPSKIRYSSNRFGWISWFALVFDRFFSIFFSSKNSRAPSLACSIFDCVDIRFGVFVLLCPQNKVSLENNQTTKWINQIQTIHNTQNKFDATNFVFSPRLWSSSLAGSLVSFVSFGFISLNLVSCSKFSIPFSHLENNKINKSVPRLQYSLRCFALMHTPTGQIIYAFYDCEL